MNSIKEKRIDYLKTKLFVQALEYARMKNLGVSLENGARVMVSFNDRKRCSDEMLLGIGDTADQLLLEMSVVDGERSAMSKEELEEYTKSIKKNDKT